MFFLESLWLLPVLCQVLPWQLHASRLPDLDSPCISFHSVCRWPSLSFTVLPETRKKINENLKGERERENVNAADNKSWLSLWKGKQETTPVSVVFVGKTGVHLSSYMKKHYRARDLPFSILKQ